MSEQGGVYTIENVVNGKKYIGSTSNYKRRFSTHKTRLNAGRHENSYLQNTFNSYGLKSLKFEILESLDRNHFGDDDEYRDALMRREIYWAEFYKTHNRKYGYNLAPIRRGGIMSEELKKKMSLLHRGENSHHAILTDNQVKMICQGIMNGEKSKNLAKKYGVKPQAISCIKSGKTWRHITKNLDKDIKNPMITASKCEEVCRLLEQGKTHLEIFKLTGVSTDRVRKIGQNKTYAKIIKKYNIRDIRPTLKEPQVIEICQWINKGKSTMELMDMYNVSKRTINDIKNGKNFSHIAKKHLNVINYKPIMKDSTVIAICEMLNKGEKGREIAKKFDVSEATISMIKNKHIFTSITDAHLKTSHPRNAEIIKICELLNKGFKGREIAKICNFSETTISMIKNKHVYAEITAKYLKT